MNIRKKKSNKRFKFSKYKVIRNFIIIGIVIFMFFTLKSNAYNTNNYKTIIVAEGETLWDIAKLEKNNNSFYKNKDLRYIIRDIKEANNLTSSTIYKNQKLKIVEQ